MDMATQSSDVETRHLPIETGSRKCSKDLPDEILIEIFSYLNFEELVHSVQRVSTRWHCVAQDARLWRNLQYAPAGDVLDIEILHILQQTPKLQKLIFNRRPVIFPTLSSCFENCPELRKLQLFFNQILCIQSLTSLVKNCQKLQHLSIDSRNLSTLEGAQMIGQLQKLTTLNIGVWGYRPQLVLLKPIADGCPLLQHLDVQYNTVSSDDLKYFMQMKQHQLQSITIKWTTAEGKCTIPHLTVCKTLKHLAVHNLRDVEITAGFYALRSMKTLTSLTFTEMVCFRTNNLESLFNNKGMCHLKELKFDTYMGDADELSETVCNNCPLLKVLALINCVLTNKSLVNLYKLEELEYLNLYGSRGITGTGTDFVFQCKHLKYLNLYGCALLTMQCMKQLTGLHLLETLILDQCNIVGLQMNLISTSLPKLKLLSVNFCEGVNLGKLHQLHAEMPHLTVNAALESEWSSSSSTSSSW